MRPTIPQAFGSLSEPASFNYAIKRPGINCPLAEPVEMSILRRAVSLPQLKTSAARPFPARSPAAIRSKASRKGGPEPVRARVEWDVRAVMETSPTTPSPMRKGGRVDGGGLPTSSLAARRRVIDDCSMLATGPALEMRLGKIRGKFSNAEDAKLQAAAAQKAANAMRLAHDRGESACTLLHGNEKDENREAEIFYVDPSRRFMCGPERAGALQEKLRLAADDVHGDCLAWTEGMPDWQPLSSLPEMQPKAQDCSARRYLWALVKELLWRLVNPSAGFALMVSQSPCPLPPAPPGHALAALAIFKPRSSGGGRCVVLSSPTACLWRSASCRPLPP